MSRVRVLAALLGLILLACIAVVLLDQRGAFGDAAQTPSGPSQGLPNTPPVSGEPGYGDLK
ncbi:hypothetical protein Dcar01_02995 [Deinococcus carri]|uniref:Uncharacterized protein n=1 Tax=Deinococcus carri TaxID=1211323 RepID=A0ABP9WBW5_9DEIO